MVTGSQMVNPAFVFVNENFNYFLVFDIAAFHSTATCLYYSASA
jgi:hypothetical protein